MNKSLFYLLAAISLCICSCNKENIEESNFSYPVRIGTKSSDQSPLKITNLSLITDDDPELPNTDFLSCQAWMNPDEEYDDVHRTRFVMYDEIVTLMMFVPDIKSLKPGQVIKPVKITFSYLYSNNIGHTSCKVTSGKLIYRGLKEDKALFEFQDVLFVTDPTRFVSDGNHLISGTMECPVFKNFSEERDSLL